MFDPTLPVALWAMTSLTHLGMNSYRKDPTKEPFAIPTQFSHLSNLQYLDIGTYAPDIGKKKLTITTSTGKCVLTPKVFFILAVRTIDPQRWKQLHRTYTIRDRDAYPSVEPEHWYVDHMAYRFVDLFAQRK